MTLKKQKELLIFTLKSMTAKEFYEWQLQDNVCVVGRQDKDEIIMLMQAYHDHEINSRI